MGQRVGLSTSISDLPPSLDRPEYQAQGRVDGSFAGLVVGQALGTRTISFISLPTPVDKRAPPAAPESEAEADTLSILGEWVLSAGLPCLVWNMSWQTLKLRCHLEGMPA